MNNLHNLLDAFHTAILEKDNSQAIPAMKVNPRISPEAQLAIYIDGYRMRLIEAIRSDYPALLLYLGESAFDELALHYIENIPPHHFNLDRYPHDFASVIHEHINDDFAADLATLEAAIARVFMMEESKPLAADALTGITLDALASMVMKPRTASSLLHLRYPAGTYMADMREGHTPLKPEAETRYLFLVRHHNEVKRHTLDLPQYLILSNLHDGKTVGDALELVIEQHPELLPDISTILQNGFAYWIGHGFFQPTPE